MIPNISSSCCFVYVQLAKLVADEFFDQGDMEKLQLNITPIVSSSMVHLMTFSVSRTGFNLKN